MKLEKHSRIMTVEDVAEELRISRVTVYRLLKNGEIPGAFRLNERGAWRVNSGRLMGWIKEQQTNGKRKGGRGGPP